MIAKETDNKILDNKYKKSGFDAEKQMSFYLKRAFKDHDHVYVLNDLRLNIDDEFAQIDHLVIHRFGFIVVESKSVSSRVHVNKYGEWKRIFNDKESGMPSPVQQAKRQIDFLMKFLANQDTDILYAENFLNKHLPLDITKFSYNFLVAISDDGIIERDGIELPELHKADLICDKINEIIAQYLKKMNKLVPVPWDIPYNLRQDSIKKIVDLLINSHSPLHETNNEPTKNEVPKEEKLPPIVTPYKQTNTLEKSRVYDIQEIYTCQHCKSPNLQIMNGQYSYYFKCLFCHKNTQLKLVCSEPTPQCKPKLEPQGAEFYRVCDGCNERKLFFTNIEKNPTPTQNIEPPIEKPKPSPHNCHKCKSTNLQIAYGQYGYYFKCEDCDSNSKLNLSCNKPSCKPKITKDKLNFYKVCSDCDIKELFFVNNK